jgi:hypothetical protein
MFLEEGAGDFAGFGEGGAGDEDETELGDGGHGVGGIVADFDLGGEEGDKDSAEFASERRGSQRRGEEEALCPWIVRAHLSQEARKVGTLKFRWQGLTKDKRVTVECGDYGYNTDCFAD